jgi:hypothetical protein
VFVFAEVVASALAGVGVSAFSSFILVSLLPVPLPGFSPGFSPVQTRARTWLSLPWVSSVVAVVVVVVANLVIFWLLSSLSCSIRSRD